MEGFEREIDTELFSGLFGGSGLFYGLFPKKVDSAVDTGTSKLFSTSI